LKFEKNTVRTGARYAPTTNQDLIVSAIYSDWKRNALSHNFGQKPLAQKQDSEAFQAEAQYLLRKNFINFIAGTGVYDIRSNLIDENNFRFKSEQQSLSAYLYTNLNLPNNIKVTLGTNHTSYELGTITNSKIVKINETDPKLGIQWDILQNFRLRLAWFETVRRSLLTEQTLEPTQIAGFNQFFDDPIGAKTRRKGIGLDTHFSKNFYGGIEASERQLKIPFSTGLTENQKEHLYRVYFYGLVSPFWSITSEIKYEKFTRKESLDNNGIEPNNIQTLSLPVSLQFFNPNGFFFKLTSTFVSQDLIRLQDIRNINEVRNSGEYPENLKIEGSSNFFLFDAIVGYRLPNRRGLVSFEGRNLLNDDFLFRNPQFYVSQPTSPRYFPSRSLFVQFTFNF
jgi:hypothetical protein